MRFPPSFLEEIRARLPISEVVGRRVTWDRRKSNPAKGDFWACCPFHQEKTPSFHVDDRKGFYHCFGCQKSGDAIGFVRETEGLNFPEAVERLASLAGLPLPQVSPEDEKREARRKTLYEVVELAAKFFEESLQSRTGARARGYLVDRGIAPAISARFRLGYAPAERFALKEYLDSKQVPVEDMVEAGLLVSGDDIPVPFDRFRERVMFPISDFKGRVVGFGGRALAEDAQAKYLNSPETPLFHKGWLLYHGGPARTAAQKDEPLVVVEGYMDAIAMVAAGFEATVAPLGTALTEEQLGLIWRIAPEPILCFDGDAAGERAAFRALDLALPQLAPGKSLRFAILPEGQDPDDLIRSGGVEAMQEVLAAARPLAEMLWRRETADARLDTPERRAALEAKLGEILRAIGDETVRRHYRDELQARLKRLFAPAETETRRPFAETRGRARSLPTPRAALGSRSSRLAHSPVVRRSALPSRDALILLAVMNHPWLLADHAEELAELELAHRDADSLRRALLDAAAAGSVGDSETLAQRLEQAGCGPALASIKRAITHASDWGVRADAAAEDVLTLWHQIVSLHRKKRTLSKELKEAERALGTEPTDANFAWLKDVQQRLANLDGTEALIEGFGAPSGRPARSM